MQIILHSQIEDTANQSKLATRRSTTEAGAPGLKNSIVEKRENTRDHGLIISPKKGNNI